MPAVAQLPIGDVPFCILDLETTGLSPGLDRVVELSVVRLEPDGDAQVVLDSLIHPQRSIAGTEVHGITDAAVASAPTFERLAPEFLEAMDGAVLAAYNVYFDLRFLQYELGRIGHQLDVPYLCVMYARPLLDLGSRCTLRLACEDHGIEHVGGHSAAGDVVAATELMQHYLGAMKQLGVRTLGDLRRRGKRYKFLKSFDLDLPRFPKAATPVEKVSRALEPTDAADDRWRIREYQEMVLALLSDFVVSTEEANVAREIAGRLGLTIGEVRAVHARIFASTLNQWAADDEIDDNERVYLNALHRGLDALGWAPGG
ncbi:MAG: 3'-5' exonuclease [Myxococcales bacterium]|nr:3'-5' exonuclease [Myxococcales bacterium]